MVEKHYILLEFESLSQTEKNIFFVAFIQMKEATLLGGFFRFSAKPSTSNPDIRAESAFAPGEVSRLCIPPRLRGGILPCEEIKALLPPRRNVFYIAHPERQTLSLSYFFAPRANTLRCQKTTIFDRRLSFLLFHSSLFTFH